jgi:hypothetical protein
MAFVHGKDTYVSLDGVDISAFATESEYTRTADSHDVTTFGQGTHVYQGGLTDGTFSVNGVYDSGTTTPRTMVEPLVGTNVDLVRRPEGTGSGLPQDTVEVLVVEYAESNPVADMVTWSVSGSFSGAISTVDQSA